MYLLPFHNSKVKQKSSSVCILQERFVLSLDLQTLQRLWIWNSNTGQTWVVLKILFFLPPSIKYLLLHFPAWQYSPLSITLLFWCNLIMKGNCASWRLRWSLWGLEGEKLTGDVESVERQGGDLKQETAPPCKDEPGWVEVAACREISYRRDGWNRLLTGVWSFRET